MMISCARVTAYDPGFALGNARVLIDLHAAVQEGKDHEDGGRVAQVRAVGVRAGRARAGSWNAPPRPARRRLDRQDLAPPSAASAAITDADARAAPAPPAAALS